MARRARMEVVGGRASVTALELFFDLVFVFALTQVTALMARESTVTVMAVVRGTLILAVLWWCWVAYAWLFNVIRADEGVARAAMFGAMGGMFIAAITIPEAFDDLPGGLPGPTVFAACYFVVRAMHILMFWLASRDDPTLRGQVMRFVPTMLAGTLLLLIAAQTTGSVSRARLTVVVLLVALTPLVAGLPALATLAVLTGVLVTLIAYETVHYAVQRHAIRDDTAHRHAHEDH